MTGNLLAAETSPYLLQHKDNPVHWQAWGSAALAQAAAQNKPILLSVGYAACHWCHVMAHESFEDSDIAAVMNAHFVCIKVDREERPDIDAIYQNALALLGQQGGWPLTMFLTPKAEPFWGGTYFPPHSRWGRPGFVDVLMAISGTYHGEPDKVLRNTMALREALGRMASPKTAADRPVLSAGLLDSIAQRLVREIDPLNGGVGDAPKFPQTAALGLLWRAFLRTGKVPYRQAVITSLTSMAQGGIYDHLGGGFARYSVDAAWLVPHFEKMLYDNAQLLELLLLAWQGTGRPLFQQRIIETADWVLREMRAEGGGFASTLDADSEGEEGKFYVWQAAEIDALLAEQAPRFKEIYGVTPHGNFEGRTILNRLEYPDLLDDATELMLAQARQTLFHVRAGRVRPGWDDKVLADWNGLMITALAKAGFALDRPDWLEAACAAFAFVQDRMMWGEGRLWHAARAGQVSISGLLDDYAAMSRAALALYEVTGAEPYLHQARVWVDVVERHFRDDRDGAYFMTADDADPLIIRPRHAHDAALPSGMGQLVEVLARLWFLTGEARYQDRASAVIDAVLPEVNDNFFPLATVLNAAAFLHNAVQVVVVGPLQAPASLALARQAACCGLPHLVLVRLPPDAALPENHPANGKGLVENHPAAYVCVGQSCTLPVTQPADLVDRLVGGLPGKPAQSP